MKRLLLLAGLLVAQPVRAEVIERIETYAVSGATGLELYTSIGQRGPKASVGRAIAYTDFKLTWQRKYEPRDGGCTIVSARPKLIITYLLPKPSSRLGGPAASRWNAFYAGVQAHERVHGNFIKDLVQQIEAYSVGLSVSNDPKCSKIRTQLTQRLSELSLAQRQRSRDFDRIELSEGGAVQRLVLALVNGG